VPLRRKGNPLSCAIIWSERGKEGGRKVEVGRGKEGGGGKGERKREAEGGRK